MQSEDKHTSCWQRHSQRECGQDSLQDVARVGVAIERHYLVIFICLDDKHKLAIAAAVQRMSNGIQAKGRRLSQDLHTSNAY